MTKAGFAHALFDQPTAGQQQRDRFSGAPSVDLAMVTGAGSALALERSAPTLRSTVAGWLCTKGLAADTACAAAPAPRSAPAPAATSRTAVVSAGSDTAQVLPLTGAEVPTTAGVILLGLAMGSGTLRRRSALELTG
ncbi:MAG: hypothetical protein QOG87_1201 [Actinomycetota bacterium]|jgi:hypothetical protein